METRTNRFLNSLIRKFFHLLYHPLAIFYDPVAWLVSCGLWFDWVAAAGQYLDKEPVLELGSGTGHLQQNLIRNGVSVFGLEESWQMLRIARQAISKPVYKPNLVRGSSQALPFSANTFQRIAATFPSEYILDPETLSEVHRVLTQGGQLVVLPAAWILGGTLPQRLARKLISIIQEAPPGDTIRNTWQREMETRLKHAGLSVQHKIIPARDSEILMILACKPKQTK